MFRLVPGVWTLSRRSASDHLWRSDPEWDSEWQNVSSLSLKPDQCHPSLPSRAAPGAMMSVSPSPAVNTVDHGGDPWGGEVLQSLIRNQVKTNPRERARRSMVFGVLGSECWRHGSLCVKTRGDVRRLLMSRYSGLQ